MGILHAATAYQCTQTSPTPEAGTGSALGGQGMKICGALLEESVSGLINEAFW